MTGPGEAPSNTPSILALLETLQSAPHLEVHKDMIRWILKVKLHLDFVCYLPYSHLLYAPGGSVEYFAC